VLRKHSFSFNKTLKLDLGCGPVQYGEYIGIDERDFGQPIVWDLTQGIPLPDQSVDEIITFFHFLEHVPQDKIVDLWQEMYRVLIPKGKITIRVPHADDTRYAFIPAHRSQWTEKSIECLCNLSGDLTQNTATKFKIIKNMKIPRGTLCKSHGRNGAQVADELYVELEKEQ